MLTAPAVYYPLAIQDLANVVSRDSQRWAHKQKEVLDKMRK